MRVLEKSFMHIHIIATILLLSNLRAKLRTAMLLTAN